MADWIKCSERMPKMLQAVWCYGTIPTISNKQFGFEGWRNKYGFIAENNSNTESLCERAEVTHWQPLPEPPQE